MKKVLSWILCLAMLMSSVVALADTVASPEADTAAGVPIIDFEDDIFAFLGVDTAAGNADASELSIVDYNGSKLFGRQKNV